MDTMDRVRSTRVEGLRGSCNFVMTTHMFTLLPRRLSVSTKIATCKLYTRRELPLLFGSSVLTNVFLLSRTPANYVRSFCHEIIARILTLVCSSTFFVAKSTVTSVNRYACLLLPSKGESLTSPTAHCIFLEESPPSPEGPLGSRGDDWRHSLPALHP